MTEATRKKLAKALGVRPAAIELDAEGYDSDGEMVLYVDKEESDDSDPWGGYTDYHNDKCRVSYEPSICCGMAELYNLDDITNLPKKARAPFVTAVREALAEQGYGLAVATTIPAQRAARVALSAGGFHIVGRGIGRHGYPVTMHRAELKKVKR